MFWHSKLLSPIPHDSESLLELWGVITCWRLFMCVLYVQSKQYLVNTAPRFRWNKMDSDGPRHLPSFMMLGFQLESDPGQNQRKHHRKRNWGRVHTSSSLWLSAVLCGHFVRTGSRRQVLNIGGLLGRTSCSLFLMVVAWPHLQGVYRTLSSGRYCFLNSYFACGKLCSP